MGHLCWLSRFGSDGKKILHLRLDANHSWQPYTAFPHLCVPDYPAPGGSKGWATSQRLMKSGWVLIPTDQAYRVCLRLAS
jgi:hypothetical protein